MLWLTKLSLRRPVTLAMALVSVLLLGSVSVLKLPLDFLPRVEFPFIAVWIPYQGGIPSENEQEIVRPIEEVLATLGGVQEIFGTFDCAWIERKVRVGLFVSTTVIVTVAFPFPLRVSAKSTVARRTVPEWSVCPAMSIACTRASAAARSRSALVSVCPGRSRRCSGASGSAPSSCAL